ncbi:hypothetical protein [Spiroplasma endosymbiont of Clivina fossor]|uniref:hypothetical protein n=1 Tax=Spiroplasma endosymbiont of Clivina fossor TaxID=3066282 RepID=UPI00313DEEE5
MKLIDVDKIAHIIKQVVSITPGVVAFAYSRENKENEDAIALEKDITPAIDVKKLNKIIMGLKFILLVQFILIFLKFYKKCNIVLNMNWKSKWNLIVILKLIFALMI